MSDEPKRPYYDPSKSDAAKRAAQLIADLKRELGFGTCRIVPNPPQIEQAKK